MGVPPDFFQILSKNIRFRKKKVEKKKWGQKKVGEKNQKSSKKLRKEGVKKKWG